LEQASSPLSLIHIPANKYSMSFLERERERERQRQKEWERDQTETMKIAQSSRPQSVAISEDEYGYADDILDLY